MSSKEQITNLVRSTNQIQIKKEADVIVQNNSTPWVILIIFAAALLVTATFIISNNEVFNPIQASQEAVTRATFGAIAAESTQMALRPTQIAFQATQAAQAQMAEATAAPMRMTATQIAGEAALAEYGREATATSMALQITAQAQNLAEQNAQTAKENGNVIFGQRVKLIGTILIYLAVFGVGGGVAYCLVAIGRARTYNAKAKLLTEQRHTMEVEAAIRTKSSQLGLERRIAQNSSRFTKTNKGGENDYSNLPLAE